MHFTSLLKIFIFSSLFLFNVGCALGPVFSHSPARTNGSGKGSFQFMSTSETYIGLKAELGLLDSLDVGLQLESLNSSAYLKWALLNQDKGTSFAITAGSGSSVGGSFGFGDLTLSYKGSHFEPYIAGRYVSVKSTTADLEGADISGIISSVTIPEFKYGVGFLGLKYWFNKSFGIGFEGMTFVEIDPEVQFSSGGMFSIGLDFRL